MNERQAAPLEEQDRTETVVLGVTDTNAATAQFCDFNASYR